MRRYTEEVEEPSARYHGRASGNGFIRAVSGGASGRLDGGASGSGYGDRDGGGGRGGGWDGDGAGGGGGDGGGGGGGNWDEDEDEDGGRVGAYGAYGAYCDRDGEETYGVKDEDSGDGFGVRMGEFVGDGVLLGGFAGDDGMHLGGLAGGVDVMPGGAQPADP